MKQGFTDRSSKHRYFSQKKFRKAGKSAAALFLVIAVLSSLLCACGQQKTEDPETFHTSRKPEVTVSELYSEDGVGHDSAGTEYTYSYHVPQIEDDTPGATAINGEIAARYGELVKACMESVKKNEVPPCVNVTYESFRYEDTLSLLIRYTSYYGGELTYGTYNYDTGNGTMLENAGILAMKELTQEQYLNAVRRAAVKCYDEQYFSIWEEYGFDNTPGAYQERRSWTISSRNITTDLPLYLDNDGALHTIAAVGSHTGSDRSVQDLILDFAEKDTDTETVDLCDFLEVTRQGRKITLRLSETELGKTILEAGGLDYEPYDIKYTVNGLWSDYTQVYCGLVGLQDSPYVFLLTEEGRVEYIDVITCLKGCYFCAGGPLLGVDGVKSFDANIDYDNGAYTVYAILEDGSSVNLAPLLEIDRQSLGDPYLGNWGCQHTAMTDGESYEELVSVTLAGCDDMTMICRRPDQDETMECEVSLTYLGITESGVVYYYHLRWIYSNGPGYEGTIALETEDDYSGDVPTHSLHITELGGATLLGNATGETTSLEQQGVG